MNTGDSCSGSFVAGACPGDSTIKVRVIHQALQFKTLMKNSAASPAAVVPIHPPVAVPVQELSMRPSKKKASPTSGVEVVATDPRKEALTALVNPLSISPSPAPQTPNTTPAWAPTSLAPRPRRATCYSGARATATRATWRTWASSCAMAGWSMRRIRARRCGSRRFGPVVVGRRFVPMLLGEFWLHSFRFLSFCCWKLGGLVCLFRGRYA